MSKRTDKLDTTDDAEVDMPVETPDATLGIPPLDDLIESINPLDVPPSVVQTTVPDESDWVQTTFADPESPAERRARAQAAYEQFHIDNGLPFTAFSILGETDQASWEDR